MRSHIRSPFPLLPAVGLTLALAACQSGGGKSFDWDLRRSGLSTIGTVIGSSRSQSDRGGGALSSITARNLIAGQDPLDQLAHARRVAVGEERVGLEPVSGVAREGEVVVRIAAPATIADADTIIVMEGGRIIERGHHRQLLAAGGRYAEMWRLQQESELVEG